MSSDAMTNARDSGMGQGTRARRNGAPTQSEIVDFMLDKENSLQGFAENVLNHSVYVVGSLPWDQLGEERRWTDVDEQELFRYLQDGMGTNSRKDVQGAFLIVAAKRRFNPIERMLDDLPEWDGKDRASTLLSDLLGCEDTPYVRAVCNLLMQGAVRRAYEPGCKFDYVVILMGPQGCGKSSTLRALAMDESFLCEGVTDLTDLKGTAEQTMGKWFVELAELEGMTGRRLTGIKQSVTMQQATVRLPYAHNAVDIKRSCVFVATTNDARFLTDVTGNRRFLPVRCAVTGKGWAGTNRELEAHVMQAWAEVVAGYKWSRQKAKDPDEFDAMFRTWLTPEQERMAEAERDAYTVEDTRTGVVREWLDDVVAHEGLTRVCTRMIAERALGLRERDVTRRVTNEIATMLDSFDDWRNIGRQRVNGYSRPNAWEYSPT